MKKKVLSLFIALALIVTLLPAGAFASDPGSVEWAGAMNMNAENNQVTEASVPLSPETTALKWQYALNTVSDCWGAYYAGQTVIADDYLYATGGGHLHKISTADGTAVSASVSAGSAAFYYDYLCCGGGMIFVATTGSITAYDLSDLSTKWTVSANYGYYHPVQYLAVGEMAYIYCNGFVYKASDGTAVTLKNKDEEALAATFNWSSGAVVDGYFYVASTTAVYAINMSTWTVLDSWEYAASATLAPGVAYDDTTGRIYFGSYTSSNIYSAKIDTGTHGFDTAEGSKIEAAVSQPTCCTPVIYNGRVYLAGQSGKIDVLNSETLEMIYSAAGSGTKIQDNPILSTAGAAADNNYTVHLCFQNYNGDIFILKDNINTTSGSVVKIAEGSNPTNVTWPCSYEQIAIDDEGNIYCYNESGYLFCYTETSAYLTALTPSKSELSTSFAAGMESYELVIPAGETSVSLAVTPCEGGSVMVGTDVADLEELVLTEGSGSVDVDSITTTATTFYIKAVCGSDSRIYSVSIRQKNSETGIHVVTSTSNNITSGTEAIAATGNLYTVTTMSGIRVWLGLQDANASFGSWTILDGTALNLTTTTRTNTYDDLVYQKRIFSSSFKEGQSLASVTVTAEDGATTQTYYFALSCEDEFVKATENVYVTIADEGSFVTGTDADSTLLANAPVMVTDLNTDGNFNVDETLYAAHEAYYSGGAAAGYGSSETQWGLSLTKLWGDTSSCYGYWVNNASAWSLEDSVESGDYVTAFVYKDQTSWSDTYTAFSARSYSATAGNPVTLTLNAYTYNPSTYGYDEGAYTEGASISVVGTSISGVTDENGQVTLTLPSAGTYTLTATETDGSIVPAACKVAVAAPTQTITVNFT
ncbi:MAG: hypothetical protein EOM14_09805, partial [Clostridia bacterium]|nr:hypothetical protein [Clostridia bacterium]